MFTSIATHGCISAQNLKGNKLSLTKVHTYTYKNGKKKIPQSKVINCALFIQMRITGEQHSTWSPRNLYSFQLIACLHIKN